ncbi:MAG: Hpt domain-containing protein, partial [bacterium]
MADTRQDTSSKLAGIDLSQFYQVFFEEAGENLESMEQMLLELDLVQADEEELNAIFRCAHSVKGGAATFGFADVAELTHEMETLLDKLRRRELAPNSAMVDALLASGDALKAMLARHQGGGGDQVDVRGLLATIRALVEGREAPAGVVAAAVAAPSAAPAPAAAPPHPRRTTARALELTVGPLPDPAMADNLVELFQEIPDLGTIEPLDGGRAAEGLRRFRVVTTTADSELIDLFSFHVAREQVRLKVADAGYGFHEDAPGAPPPVVPPDLGYGFFA